MSREFTRVDRELVELAIDLVASGEETEYALSRAAWRLREAGRKGVRFTHVNEMRARLNPRGWTRNPDSIVASLRAVLKAMT